jgi:hypothetical protein
VSQLHYRNGNAAACQTCGGSIIPKRGSRRQRCCNRRCREKAYSDRKWSIRHRTPNIRRSVQNFADGPNPYRRENGSRGSAIRGPRHVIQAEIVDAHKWHEAVSRDGVRSWVTTLHKPGLVVRA